MARRVTEIQNLLSDIEWGHVGTTDNPADLANRGISSEALRLSSPWWGGPSWLPEVLTTWPYPPGALDGDQVPEQRTGALVAFQQICEPNEYLFRFSNLSRFVRVTAYISRFLRIVRDPDRKMLGHLTTNEHRRAEARIFRLSQLEGYPQVLEALNQGKPLPVGPPLNALNPFVDSEGVMRVGGRLRNAPVSYDQRHPLILSRHTHMATLIIEAAHLTTLHGGIDLTRTSMLQRFWIPRCRPLMKAVLRRCLRCTRFKASTGHQQIGDLPAVRLQPARSFELADVDYAGPIPIRTSKDRGQRACKRYIVVFVCLCTKAVHLGAISDLSIHSFLAAFKHFIFRRGRCSQL